MSIEKYAVHTAPRGGKIDLIVDKIFNLRVYARMKRMDYSRSKKADGLYQCEANVSGLVFKNDSEIPPGWARSHSIEDGVVAIPKAKDRTKESRALVKVNKAELAALPAMPGAWEFTNMIGSSQVIGSGEGGRFCLLNCWFERVGGTTFVMTPWVTESEKSGNLDDDSKIKTALVPDGCSRVGLSTYYAAKEASEAEKPAAVSA